MSKGPTKNVKTKKPKESDWAGIISAIRSPLSLFGLIVLVSNAVFAFAATSIESEISLEAFKYAIHMFMGIVGAFIMIALWHPSSLYHPKELEELRDDILGDKKPKKIITAVLFMALFSYMGYQIYMEVWGKPKIDDSPQTSINEEKPGAEERD